MKSRLRRLHELDSAPTASAEGAPTKKNAAATQPPSSVSFCWSVNPKSF